MKTLVLVVLALFSYSLMAHAKTAKASETKTSDAHVTKAIESKGKVLVRDVDRGAEVILYPDHVAQEDSTKRKTTWRVQGGKLIIRSDVGETIQTHSISVSKDLKVITIDGQSGRDGKYLFNIPE